MAIKRVLEKDEKWGMHIGGLTTPKSAKVNLKVLCECLEEYEINEKFGYTKAGKNWEGAENITRSSECPSCEDRTFLTYNYRTYTKDGWYGYVIKISPNATKIRKGSGKDEQITVEV